MRFFTYSPDIELGLLWGHLHAIGERTEVSTEPEYEHTYDIIMSALNGSFNLHQESFNHFGYELKSRQRDDHSKTAKAKNKLNIIDDAVKDFDQATGYGDTTASKVLVDFEEAFDQIDSSETLKRGIEELVEQRSKIQDELGLDIVVSLSQSLNDHPGAMQVIREICVHAPNIRELITDILESSASLTRGGTEVDLRHMLEERLK